MNAERRKRIEKAVGMIADARSILEDVTSDEQEAFDNMPESIQASERGEKMEEFIEILEEAVSALEEVEGNLEEIV